ncbi:MAG: DNA polymerase III subunit alpha [Planctomycetaceae bacterium]|nr:DNA polymerase III subunit alpha [Planctomycetaceae bacterium]
MSDAQPFAHLHCHSHYSLLDGANRIPDLVAKVKADGMNALALTDHGNLYGSLHFYKECRAQDINPILGYEAYVAPGHRTDRTPSKMKEAAFHLTLLAQDRSGFQNLIKMASKAYLEGFYYKPRIDKELLEAHSDGLICLSGCASSELSQLVLAGQADEARQLIEWYQRVFDDRFYLEIQNAGLQIQQECLAGTVDLSQRMGVPLVATNDSHYLTRDDAVAHDVLLCVNTRTVITDDKRMQLEGNEFFVRSPEEMYAAFPGHADAVARSQEIADLVEIEIDFNTRHYPVFSPPEGKTDTGYLRELCEARLGDRYGDEITDTIRERLDEELRIIEEMGYSSYFLIVWDFVRFAMEEGIPCQARGSACGSLVAYLLKLSNVCPLKYDLLFERFLDPSRNEPPDIDIDFCRDRRQRVIDYTKEKYGEANVAQIGTFGTLKAKAAIRDVGRALDVPLARVDEIAKMVPDTLGITLEESLRENPDLEEQYNTDPQIKRLLEIAMRLEGLARSAGTHAAGVVIGEGALENFVPLQKISGKTDVVTQWRDKDVEYAGLLKMDFLGLRNLSILDKTVKNVRANHGLDIDPNTLPLDDVETYQLLQRGETKGVFQLESGGMRTLLTKIKPDSFNDIIATSALYRPGPLEGGMVMTYVDVKHGRESTPSVHPIVDDVLAETYGVMVYQEQVMRILNRVGGIELSSAYRCIKAISKKQLDVMQRFREEFVEGAKTRDLAEHLAIELFDMIEKFAGYGFNKSHSTAYGAIAYQTAYFKAHYPLEFMAALLSCEMENTDRISEHVDDCRRMNLTVLPPCVNHSSVDFVVEGEALRFGLAAIKGVGESAVAALATERQTNGDFKNFFNLTERIDPKAMTKGVLEILIKSGALDCLGSHRNQHFQVVERAVQSAAARHRDRARGQKSLFGDIEDTGPDENATADLPAAAEWPQSQQLAFEKEVLGFYLTSHPLAEYSSIIGRHASHNVLEAATLEEGTEILLGGMITSIRTKQTRRPSRNGHTRFADFNFEDLRGNIRCIIWPEDYSRLAEKLEPESCLFLQGKIDRRGREPSLVVHNALTREEAEREFTRQLAIKFRHGVHSRTDMDRTREILGRHPGRVEVIVIVETNRTDAEDAPVRYIMSTPGDLRVSCSRELQADLTRVLGENDFEFHTSNKRRNNGDST